MERTEKLYPIGEIPPIGVVPKKCTHGRFVQNDLERQNPHLKWKL